MDQIIFRQAFYVLLSLTFFSCSCDVVRSRKSQTSDSSSVQNSGASRQESGSLKSLQSDYRASIDSNTTLYVLDIVPEGEVSFTAKDGFKGKAKRIRVLGQVSEESRQLESKAKELVVVQQSDSSGKTQTKSTVAQKDKQQNSEKGMSVGSTLFYLLLLAMLLLLFFLIRRNWHSLYRLFR